MLRPRSLFVLSLVWALPLVAQAPVDPEPDAQSLGRRTGAQYRSSYFYAASQWALLQGQAGTAELLLKQAQVFDPASDLIAQERAILLEGLGRDAEAQPLLEMQVQKDPKDMDLRKRLSRVYQRSGQWDKARALFLAADGAEPQDAESLRNLAGLDLMRGELAAAEVRLQRVAQLSGEAEDQELWALVLARLDKPKDAAAALRALLAKDPSRASAWAQLSASLDAAGDTPAAAAALEDGLKEAPGSALLLDRQAKLAYRNADYPLAEKAFGALLQQDPEDGRSLLYRGLARLRGKRYQEAEADFQALAAKDEDDPGPAYALALALVLQKRYGEAQGQLEALVKKHPQSMEAWAQLAYVTGRLKGDQGPLAVLQRAFKANPKSEEAALLLAGAWQESGKPQEAVALLRQALKAKDGATLRFQLAATLDKLGRFEEAEKELKAIIAAHPKHAPALNYLGYSYADQGRRLSEAEDLIRRALAEEPRNRYYLDSLGWVLFKRGQAQAALEPLMQAAAAAPADAGSDEAVVFDHLAQVHAALGQAQAAAEVQRKAEAIRSREPAQAAPALSVPEP